MTTETKPRVRFFAELWSVIRPAEPIDTWNPYQKRKILMYANSERANLIRVMRMMGLDPEEWSVAEKKEIAEQLNMPWRGNRP
jgi:hypothetical protein